MLGGKNKTDIAAILLEKPELSKKTGITAETILICSGFVGSSGWVSFRVSETDCDWTRDNGEK